MRPAQRARERLRGRWISVILLQWMLLLIRVVLIILQIIGLYLLGGSVEVVVRFGDIASGRAIGYAGVTLLFLALDLLVMSPLYLGRTLFYLRVSAGEEAKPWLLFRFFGKDYRRALRLRFFLLLRQTLWTALFLLPAALITGYAAVVRNSGVSNSFADLVMLYSTVFGWAFFLGGLLAANMLMLRYWPAQLLVALGQPVEGVFRRSAQIMKGRVGDILWLHVGFSGWFLSFLFVIPYVYVMPLLNTTLTMELCRCIVKAPREDIRPQPIPSPL